MSQTYLDYVPFDFVNVFLDLEPCKMLVTWFV